MEAEPEMFGAAIAAPEDSAYGSFARPATLELRTWATGSTEVALTNQDLSQLIDAETSADGRFASPIGRAIVGSIALAQVIWWVMLAYVALRLFVL
jgi:hypothetical protein